jgi:hypothetical protein
LNATVRTSAFSECGSEDPDDQVWDSLKYLLPFPSIQSSSIFVPAFHSAAVASIAARRSVPTRFTPGVPGVTPLMASRPLSRPFSPSHGPGRFPLPFPLARTSAFGIRAQHTSRDAGGARDLYMDGRMDSSFIVRLNDCP